jgi:hypothetical protein
LTWVNDSGRGRRTMPIQLITEGDREMSRTMIAAATAALLLGTGLAAAQMQQGQGQQVQPQQQPGTAAGQGQQMPGMGQMQGRGMMRGPDDRGGMMMGRGMYGGMDRGPGPHAMRPHMMLMMMALVDTDGSKTLSLEEVQAVHARLFAYADADGDGELTLAEMRDFMQGEDTAEEE